MFAEKEKVVKDSKGALERINYLEGKYSETGATLIVSDAKSHNLKRRTLS